MTDIDVLRSELAALRAEVAALRGSAAVPAAADEPVSRRGLLGKLAGAAVAGAGLAVLGSAPAEATAGNPVILGASGTTNDSGTVGTYVKATTSVEHAFDVTQQGAGIALGVDTTHTTTTQPALWVVQNGLGSAVEASVLNSDSTASAVYAYGRPTGGTGVEAHGAVGVHGYDDNGGGSGVLGETTGGNGVYGYSGTGRAVYGYSGGGESLYGYSNGTYGLWVHGTRAQAFFDPMGTAGPPASGTHSRGEVWIDVNGVHWHCVAPGTPGTWVRPGFNPVTPYRLLSGTTATGTFATGTARDLAVAGAHGIPAGALAAAVNISATSTGTGSLTLYRTGTARPGVAHVSYGPAYKWSGFAVVPLSPTGKLTVYASAGTTHVSLDVAGFFA
jgi:hypothetical protein